MVATREQRRALEALVGRALIGRGRFVVFASWSLVVLLAGAMLVVHGADGARGFFEGVVARGVSLHLLLVSLPFAFALAGGAATLDPGHAALARMRALGDTEVALAGPRAALRLAAWRTAAPSLLLAALAGILSLGDSHHVARRLLVSGLLALLGVVAATALSALGVLSARLGGRRGRWVLLAIVAVPWLAAEVSSLPSEVSLPGAYDAAVDAILGLAG